MDIEFIVQDVFTLTRPQWKLASNLEEASRAFQLAMAQDQKTSGMDKVVEPEEADSSDSSDDGIGDNDVETGLPEADAEDDSESDEEADVSILHYNLCSHANLKPRWMPTEIPFPLHQKLTRRRNQ
jgi:regulator of nonsense transcripts 2